MHIIELTPGNEGSGEVTPSIWKGPEPCACRDRLENALHEERATRSHRLQRGNCRRALCLDRHHRFDALVQLHVKRGQKACRRHMRPHHENDLDQLLRTEGSLGPREKL